MAISRPSPKQTPTPRRHQRKSYFIKDPYSDIRRKKTPTQEIISMISYSVA